MSESGRMTTGEIQEHMPSPHRIFPFIQNVVKSANGKGCIKGCSHLTRKLLATENEEFRGRHFLFDKTYERLERTRTLIPPLPRNYHVHRSGNLHHLSLLKDLSTSRPVRPLSLGSCEGYDLNTNPAFLLPSALVLNKRNTISVDTYQINRPKVNYRTCKLLAIKDNQKSHSYPEPLVGAPNSFIHRIAELSSLEGETVRQEKFGKLVRNRKEQES